jgi:ubiquinone/menaquinone biosynthesis C-methylase UbiE
LSFVAGQLRRPSGRIAGVVARFLNLVNAPMNARTLALLDLRPDDRVLELGFGGGSLLARMAAVTTRGAVVGVDFSPEMVERATRRLGSRVASGRIELRCADAAALPYPDGHFTRVCTVNTIYFWKDAHAVAAELRRVLAPGGRLVICFNPKATAEKLPFTKHGFTLYEPAEVEALLVSAGLRDVRLEPGIAGRNAFMCAVATR